MLYSTGGHTAAGDEPSTHANSSQEVRAARTAVGDPPVTGNAGKDQSKVLSEI